MQAATGQNSAVILLPYFQPIIVEWWWPDKGEEMILVDHAIQDRVRAGDLKITNFASECVQPASYDLRIGELIHAPSQPDKPYNMAANGGA
jgi:hypothetical protein